jgi:hypothetical protein
MKILELEEVEVLEVVVFLAVMVVQQILNRH